MTIFEHFATPVDRLGNLRNNRVAGHSEPLQTFLPRRLFVLGSSVHDGNLSGETVWVADKDDRFNLFESYIIELTKYL